MELISLQMLGTDSGKNDKDTSVVAVEENSHKILNCVYINTADDPTTQ